jgi:hypothetical protein
LRKSLASSGLRLLVVAIIAACMAVLLLIFEAGFQRDLADIEKMRLLQHEIGGLGMGAAAAPAWNVLHYDPRLQSVDDSNLWPIAGSYPYSPSAVSAVVAFRELPREDLRIIRIER